MHERKEWKKEKEILGQTFFIYLFHFYVQTFFLLVYPESDPENNLRRMKAPNFVGGWGIQMKEN